MKKKPDMGMENMTAMNRICFTVISGHIGHFIQEFDRLESVRLVRRPFGKYNYIISFDDSNVNLYNDWDWIEYGGIHYDYRDGGLNRLWIMLENENNLSALESL